MTSPRHGHPPSRYRWSNPACRYRVCYTSAISGERVHQYWPTYQEAREFAMGRKCGDQPCLVEQRD